jgi:Rod binding domain-containing protein
MNISNTYSAPATMLLDRANAAQPEKSEKELEVRENFDKFVGEVFYGQLLKAMRSTQGKPAYFHGGRAEEVFQQQFDQVLTEELTESGAEQFTGPMFELFNARRF